MSNILGICLDYLMLRNDKVRGDVRQRQLDYAKKLQSLSLVVYSPRELNLKQQQWADNLWVYPTNSKNKITFILGALVLAWKICKKKKISIITTEDPFVTGFVGLLMKKLFRIPLNMQVHNDFCDNDYWLSIRKINKFFNKLAKFNLKRADTIRVGTEYEKEKLSRKLRISREKIYVIPVNSDIDKFQSAEGQTVRDSYLNGSLDKLIAFSGRFVDQKDIPTLLKAFQIVHNKRSKTALMLIGDGVKGESLRDLALELGVDKNVIFAGSVAHKEMPKYLSACDIYSISSVFEGTCIAMAEAMAAGKPVVATSFAGAQDLINNGKNGFVVDQKDYKAMAEKIIYLLDNPESARLMGEKAALTVKKLFSSNKNINRVIELWKETAKISV